MLYKWSQHPAGQKSNPDTLGGKRAVGSSSACSSFRVSVCVCGRWSGRGVCTAALWADSVRHTWQTVSLSWLTCRQQAGRRSIPLLDACGREPMQASLFLEFKTKKWKTRVCLLRSELRGNFVSAWSVAPIVLYHCVCVFKDKHEFWIKYCSDCL